VIGLLLCWSIARPLSEDTLLSLCQWWHRWHVNNTSGNIISASSQTVLDCIDEMILDWDMTWLWSPYLIGQTIIFLKWFFITWSLYREVNVVVSLVTYVRWSLFVYQLCCVIGAVISDRELRVMHSSQYLFNKFPMLILVMLRVCQKWTSGAYVDRSRCSLCALTMLLLWLCQCLLRSSLVVDSTDWSGTEPSAVAHHCQSTPRSVTNKLSHIVSPLPSDRHRRSNVDCLEGKRENYQVCSVQYCVQ